MRGEPGRRPRAGRRCPGPGGVRSWREPARRHLGTPQEAPGCEHRDPTVSRSRGSLQGPVTREGLPTGEGAEVPRRGDRCRFPVCMVPITNPSSLLPGSSQTTRRPLSPPGRPPAAPTSSSLKLNWGLPFGFLPCPLRSRPGQAREVGAAPACPGLLGARALEHRRQEPRLCPLATLGETQASTHPEVSCSPLTGSDRHVPKLLRLLLLSQVRRACSFTRPLARLLIHLRRRPSGWPGGHSGSRDSERRCVGAGALASGRLGVLRAGGSGSEDRPPAPRVCGPGLAATPIGAHGGDLNPALLLPLQGLWVAGPPASPGSLH